MDDRHPAPARSAPFDVVVAGAGPVGLFLACELRLAGLSVLVLEQAEDARSPLKRLPFGLRGLSVPTVEALDRRGLLEEVAAASPGVGAAAAHWSGRPRRPGGHFAGIQFLHDDVDPAAWRHRLPGSGDAALAIVLDDLEAALAARAGAMGVEVRRGCGVAGFDQDDDGVVVEAGGDTVRAAWLVGCDGGRSTVRKAGGFAFVGTDPEFTGYSMAIDLADPDRLPAGRHATAAGFYTFAAPGTIAMADFDGGARHRAGPVTPAQAQAVLRRITGVDVTVTAVHEAATWTDRARQAASYRDGRVLLAGDAAHVHAPLGGQGLNLGIGDAVNLGWKLAATVRGEAPDGLLDTYARERHPVGAQVLDWSRAQVAALRPDPGSRALAAVLRDLIGTRDGATYVAGRAWGTALRHDLGGGHPLVGHSVPDVTLADGTRVAERLRSGRGLFLDVDARPALRDLAGLWGDRIAYAGGGAGDWREVRALLVRPDGIVAWAGDGDADRTDALRAAARWFGEPVSGLP